MEEGKQVSSWSKEDKERLERLISYFEDREYFSEQDDTEFAEWLRTLQDRINWKPKSLYLDCLAQVIEHYRSLEAIYTVSVMKELLEQLRKLVGYEADR